MLTPEIEKKIRETENGIEFNVKDTFDLLLGEIYRLRETIKRKDLVALEAMKNDIRYNELTGKVGNYGLPEIAELQSFRLSPEECSIIKEFSDRQNEFLMNILSKEQDGTV